MAHVSITLPKAGFAFTSNLVSAVYNLGRPVVPAEWMAGTDPGSLSSFQINSSTRIALHIMSFTIPSGGELISSFKTGGTFILSYAGFQARVAIGVDASADSLGTTYTYSTSALTDTSLKWRTIFEKLQADNTDGGLTEDPVLTLWDRQGDNPVPTEVVPVSDEQTISTIASAFSRNSARYAVIPATPRPQFNAVFAPSGTDRFLEQFLIRRDRDGLLIHLADDANAALSASPGLPFSDDFLTKGHIEMTFQAEGTIAAPKTATVRLDTATILDRGDIDEPYRIDFPTGTREAIELFSLVNWMNSWNANQRFSAELKFGLLSVIEPVVTAPTWDSPSLKVTDTNGNTITEATEGTTVQLHPLVSGGTYDVATFRWRYRVGSGSWTLIANNTDNPTEWVLPDRSADTAITFQCRADFTGDGTKVEASAGRKRLSVQTIAFTIKDTVALPDAVAPTPTVTAIPNGNEGTTHTLGVTPSGGTYDSLAYLWFVYQGDSLSGVNIASTVLDDATIAAPVFTRPSVSSATNYTIGCRITATGTGVNAKSGTSDAHTSVGVTTAVNNIVLPAAAAPSIQMTLDGAVFTDGASINGDEGATSNLSLEITGGRYDVIAYIWEVKKLNQSKLLQAVHRNKDYAWQRPSVHGRNEIVTVSCEVSVNGNGTNVKAGIVQTVSVSHNTTIFNVADDGIFVLGHEKVTGVYNKSIKFKNIYSGGTKIADFS